MYVLPEKADELLLSCAGGTGKRLLKDFKNRHHMYVSPNFSCSKHWFRKTSDEAVRHSLFVPLIMLSPGRRNNHLVKKMLAPYHFKFCFILATKQMNHTSKSKN